MTGNTTLCNKIDTICKRIFVGIKNQIIVQSQIEENVNSLQDFSELTKKNNLNYDDFHSPLDPRFNFQNFNR